MHPCSHNRFLGLIVSREVAANPLGIGPSLQLYKRPRAFISWVLFIGGPLEVFYPYGTNHELSQKMRV